MSACWSILSALLGANYGANLAVFPSITKNYYGLKNFGVNYGLLFTAWGVGGFLLPLLAGWLHDRLRAFTYAYYTAAGFLVLAAVITYVVKPPHVLHDRWPSSLAIGIIPLARTLSNR